MAVSHDTKVGVILRNSFSDFPSNSYAKYYSTKRKSVKNAIGFISQTSTSIIGTIFPAALAVMGLSLCCCCVALLRVVSNMPILMIASDGFLSFLSSLYTSCDVCNPRLANHTDTDL